MNPPQYGRTFVESFKRIEPSRQEVVLQALEVCLACLVRRTALPPSLDLKRLRKYYWQIRSSLADRIIFEWHGDDIIFRLVGSHEDIRRFIKRH